MNFYGNQPFNLSGISSALNSVEQFGTSQFDRSRKTYVNDIDPNHNCYTSVICFFEGYNRYSQEELRWFDYKNKKAKMGNNFGSNNTNTFGMNTMSFGNINPPQNNFSLNFTGSGGNFNNIGNPRNTFGTGNNNSNNGTAFQGQLAGSNTFGNQGMSMSNAFGGTNSNNIFSNQQKSFGNSNQSTFGNGNGNPWGSSFPQGSITNTFGNSTINNTSNQPITFNGTFNTPTGANSNSSNAFTNNGSTFSFGQNIVNSNNNRQTSFQSNVFGTSSSTFNNQGMKPIQNNPFGFTGTNAQANQNNVFGNNNFDFKQQNQNKNAFSFGMQNNNFNSNNSSNIQKNPFSNINTNNFSFPNNQSSQNAFSLLPSQNQGAEQNKNFGFDFSGLNLKTQSQNKENINTVNSPFGLNNNFGNSNQNLTNASFISNQNIFNPSGNNISNQSKILQPIQENQNLIVSNQMNNVNLKFNSPVPLYQLPRQTLEYYQANSNPLINHIVQKQYGPFHYDTSFQNVLNKLDEINQEILEPRVKNEFNDYGFNYNYNSHKTYIDKVKLVPDSYKEYYEKNYAKKKIIDLKSYSKPREKEKTYFFKEIEMIGNQLGAKIKNNKNSLHNSVLSNSFSLFNESEIETSCTKKSEPIESNSLNPSTKETEDRINQSITPSISSVPVSKPNSTISENSVVGVRLSAPNQIKLKFCFVTHDKSVFKSYYGPFFHRLSDFIGQLELAVPFSCGVQLLRERIAEVLSENFPLDPKEIKTNLLLKNKNVEVTDVKSLDENDKISITFISKVIPSYPILGNFSSKPGKKELELMKYSKLKKIRGFEIFNEYGKIKYLDDIDVTEVSFDKFIQISPFQIQHSPEKLPKSIFDKVNSDVEISIFGFDKIFVDKETLNTQINQMKELIEKEGGIFEGFDFEKSTLKFILKKK